VRKVSPKTKIAWFIAPMVWAWKKGRIPKLARVLDLMMCTFPFEKPLFEAFLKRGKPILGICRGSQLINVCMGGTLWQDLLEQKGWVHMNGQIRHDVYAEEGSILCNIFGKQFKTNSTHHQAVKDLAPGFHVTARSIEGIIEAYEHDTLPIYATQFHPERLTGILWDDRTPDYKPWFEYFVNLVKEHAEK
jgi:putative glutamine amidotransferase